MALIVDTPGARRLDNDQLRTIPAPQGTAIWQPIAHAQTADYVSKAVEGAGFKSPKWTWRLVVVTTGSSVLGNWLIAYCI